MLKLSNQNGLWIQMWVTSILIGTSFDSTADVKIAIIPQTFQKLYVYKNDWT